MLYFKNTHQANAKGEIVTFIYELHDSNTLTRIYRQDSISTEPVEVTTQHRISFRDCRQDLNLQPITKEEFTKIMFNL